MSIEARFRLERARFTLDVDLELPGSGVTALYGRSGAGKTTLLRLLAGLEQAPGGRLAFNGTAWQDGPTFVPTHRRHLGYVFQEPSLFEHLDVRGNLEFGLRRVHGPNARTRLRHAVELLGIEGLMDRKPASLSGGERQRVAIARALAACLTVLLLDEPMASLDADRRREVLPYLESLHRELEMPVVLVSHDFEDVARLADHVVLLEEGRVRVAGPIQEALTALESPLARQDDASAVFDAEVLGVDAEFGIAELGIGEQRLQVTRGRLETGQGVRVRVHARDVSLALSRAADSSILNILPVVVEELKNLDRAQVLVRVRVAGGPPLLARITRKSASALALVPGMQAWAQVKSAALLD